MRTLLLCALVVTTSRGRDIIEDEPRKTSTPLVGTYEFGNIVQQGFAGTPGRLATMRVDSDGTFGMSYFLGCLGAGSEGAWKLQNDDLILDLNARGWVDAEGNHLDVTSLRVLPALGGVTVTGRTTDGTSFTQAWAVKP